MNTPSRFITTTLLAAGLSLGGAAFAAGAASADSGTKPAFSSTQLATYDKAGHNRQGKDRNCYCWDSRCDRRDHGKYDGHRKDKGEDRGKGRCHDLPKHPHPKYPVHPMYPQR
jgi:hypothetical protein